jgi:hypothetical protein
MVITMHQLSDPTVPITEDLPSEYEEARLRIGGECYFITNGEPRPFWQFINTVLTETGCCGPTKKISFSIAYFIAFIMEWVQWFVARLPRFLRINMEPTITRHMVCVLGRSQWYSCAKAARDLGYQPIISLDQGLETTINYFFRRKNAKLLQTTPQQPTHSLTPLHGSAPKLLTRNHSVPTSSTDSHSHAAHTLDAHHHLSASSSTLRPPPAHPDLAHASPGRATGSTSPGWPHRHWSTSPPHEGPGQASAHGPSMHQSRTPQAHYPIEHGPSQLLAPNPVRTMKQIPSVMFLNAYSHPQMLQSPTSASSTNSAPPNSVLGSPPNPQTTNSADGAHQQQPLPQ